MFPKRGNQFPGAESDRVYATMISAALRRELGETHQAIKTVVDRSKRADGQELAFRRDRTKRSAPRWPGNPMRCSSRSS